MLCMLTKMMHKYTTLYLQSRNLFKTGLVIVLFSGFTIYRRHFDVSDFALEAFVKIFPKILRDGDFGSCLGGHLPAEGKQTAPFGNIH